MTNTRVNVGEHKIALTLAGPPTSGVTFVLIHGIGVSRRYFQPLLTELSRQFRVVSLDLPGFGDSSRPKRALGIPELADVVGELVRQERWTNPVLVGQSMGCQVASQLVASHPHAVSKMILISPTTYDHERTAWQQGIRLIQDTPREPFPVNAIVFSDYLRCGIRRYLATLRHMLADQIEDRITACPTKTLIIRGGRDPIVPRVWAARLAALAPHGSLVEIDHTPHLAQYSHAHQVAKLCAQLAAQP